MKKILAVVPFAIFQLLIYTSNAQPLFNCSPLKFSGIAPAPWAIDGQTNDWQTLTGLYSGDPIFPFNLSGKPNTSYDGYGNTDLDNPVPRIDLRVLSIIHDDYNVFFYFRKLENNNLPNKAFYFFDTNLDGSLDNGEPVIGMQFNEKKVSKLTIGAYIPLNTAGDAIAGEPVCTVNGHPLPGIVNELFNSHNLDLQANEIFAAAVTENGYGVELAVPWRLISQHKYFAYRLALQSGAGSYNPSQPSDNAGGCGLSPDLIGNPDFEIQNAVITTITPGLSYRIAITFKNLTPGKIIINPADSVRIENIVQQGDLDIPETAFEVKVAGFSYSYTSGTFNQQPIIYSTSSGILGLIALLMEPFSTASVNIDIKFPPNGSVKSANIIITPKSKFTYYFDIHCPLAMIGGGGKPINPVGFILSEEETPTTATKTNNQVLAEIGQGKEVLIYPNPSSGSTNVILPKNEGPFELILTDYTGKVIKKWTGIRQKNLKLENLRSGFYLLNIKSGNYRIPVTKKILVN